MSSNLEKLAADLSQSSIEGTLTVEMLKQPLCECDTVRVGYKVTVSSSLPASPRPDESIHTCVTYIRTDTPP